MGAMGKRTRHWTIGFSTLSMALLYLLSATQIAFPVHEWFEAKAETVIKKEAFACAIHKCNCKSELQCKVQCCCFPKAQHSHSGNAEDGLAAHWANCGGGVDDHGLMPPIAQHVSLPMEVALAAPESSRHLPAAAVHPTSLDPASLLKVPIV